MPGQKKFEARDIKEYFADIDTALAIMRADGVKDVNLMRHSTGGLVTSYYMTEKPDTIVKALILNSPFLDWNMNGFMRKVAVPAVGAIGKLAPKMSISNGRSIA